MLPFQYLKICLFLGYQVWMGLLCSQAQDYAIPYEKLDINQGLSSNLVTDVYQDHRGLIWISTRDGLNCYDGHQIKTYRYDPNDANSLSDNEIGVLLGS